MKNYLTIKKNHELQERQLNKSNYSLEKLNRYDPNIHNCSRGSIIKEMKKVLSVSENKSFPQKSEEHAIDPNNNSRLRKPAVSYSRIQKLPDTRGPGCYEISTNFIKKTHNVTY